MSEHMNPGFEFFLMNQEFGPAEYMDIPSPALVDKYRGSIPNQMLIYWQTYGFCSFGKGLFWTVNPDDYASVLEFWLDGLPLAVKDHYFVLGRSAMGNLYVWGTQSGQSLTIYPVHGTIFPRDQTAKVSAGQADFLAHRFSANREKKDLDCNDAQEKPLFDRALLALGQLTPGEMYGFEPALVLGGRADIKNLRRVDAIAHLSLLAQLGERRLMRDIVQDSRRAGLME